MAKEGQSDETPVIVKKYANRRLYNTDSSTYVTLDDLAEMVKSERDFVVYDAKSGDDLTHSVLTQIIVEQESRGQNLLPIRFLRQLIRLYGDSMERLVPSYLEFSLDTWTKEQARYRKQFANAFGTTAFDALQDQARKNIAMFQKALGMFTPFATIGSEGDAQGVKPNGCAETRGQSPAEPTRPDDLATMKAELSSLQERLERLSKNTPNGEAGGNGNG